MKYYLDRLRSKPKGSDNSYQSSWTDKSLHKFFVCPNNEELCFIQFNDPEIVLSREEIAKHDWTSGRSMIAVNVFQTENDFQAGNRLETLICQVNAVRLTLSPYMFEFLRVSDHYIYACVIKERRGPAPSHNPVPAKGAWLVSESQDCVTKLLLINTKFENIFAVILFSFWGFLKNE